MEKSRVGYRCEVLSGFEHYKKAFSLAFKDEAFDKFRKVEELMKELGGETDYIVKGEHITQFRLKVRKNPFIDRFEKSAV